MSRVVWEEEGLLGRGAVSKTVSPTGWSVVVTHHKPVHRLFPLQAKGGMDTPRGCVEFAQALVNAGVQPPVLQVCGLKALHTRAGNGT